MKQEKFGLVRLGSTRRMTVVDPDLPIWVLQTGR